MSGIAGILNLNGQPADPQLLARMTDALAHRGPDGQGHWSETSIALGHRLLHTSPESLHETQPFISDDGHLVIVADARIDNRDELNAAFTSPLRTDTDVELILKAYERWGAACPDRLLGDFAFAIWDRRHRRLFCARDPIGVKPFYYHWDGHRFLFVSEITVLLEVPGLPKRIDDATVADYLLSDFRDPDATFFEEIKQLRPAHALLVDRDRLRLERYWKVDPSVVARYARDEDYLEHFRELFREAVRCRLRSRVPVGVLLSGGIDSTSVTAMAETLRQERPDQPLLFAVTVLSGGFAREDHEAIQRLTARFGTPVHVIHAQATQGSLASEEFSDPRYGAPAFGALTHPKVFEPMASQGCRVLLSGLGADHLVGMAELGVLKDLWSRCRFITLAGEIRTMAHGDARIERSILLQLLRQQLPSRTRWLIKTLLGRAVPEWIDSRLATRLGLGRRIPAPLPVRFPTTCQEESFRALTRPETALELNLMDAAAAALRMEGRHPYLDRRLIEFFLSVPAEVKRRAGCFKLFSQRALSSVVPGPFRTQEPEQYLVPIADDPQSLAFEAEWIEQTLGPSASLLVRYVGAHQLQRLLRALRNGRLTARTPLWKLVQLAWWLEDFFLDAAGRHRPRAAIAPTGVEALEAIS